MKRIKKYLKVFSWLFVPVFIFTGLTIASISKNQGPATPEPTGKDLWNYITEPNSYTNWDQWPGKEGMYEGQSPHGAHLKLYVNPQAKEALDQGFEKMPYSAIIVKENYNPEKELVAITPMYKVTDYNPEAGDWFWAKYNKDGNIMAEGKVGSCIDCHNKVSHNDYLFSME